MPCNRPSVSKVLGLWRSMRLRFLTSGESTVQRGKSTLYRAGKGCTGRAKLSRALKERSKGVMRQGCFQREHHAVGKEAQVV